MDMVNPRKLRSSKKKGQAAAASKIKSAARKSTRAAKNPAAATGKRKTPPKAHRTDEEINRDHEVKIQDKDKQIMHLMRRIDEDVEEESSSFDQMDTKDASMDMLRLLVDEQPLKFLWRRPRLTSSATEQC